MCNRSLSGLLARPVDWICRRVRWYYFAAQIVSSSVRGYLAPEVRKLAVRKAQCGIFLQRKSLKRRRCTDVVWALQRKHMRAVLGVIVLAWAAGTAADRIVAVPLCGAPSHVFIMWKVCRELVDRGHDVKVGIEGL